MLHKIFVVFGYPLTRPSEKEFLGAYTTRAAAQRFIDAQKAAVQENIGLEEVQLNKCYGDPGFWKPVRKPRSRTTRKSKSRS